MNCQWEYTGEPNARGWRFVRCLVCGLRAGPTPHAFDRIYSPCRGVPITRPGSELAAILKSVGLEPDAADTCGCRAMLLKMNIWGVEGCREHREKIVEHLRKSADKRGWLDHLNARCKAAANGLALSVNWLDPIPSLVDLAIERATTFYGAGLIETVPPQVIADADSCGTTATIEQPMNETAFPFVP